MSFIGGILTSSHILGPSGPQPAPTEKGCVCMKAAVALKLSFFFFRFYLFIHERDTERERQRHRQREKQAPLREPDVGLDPGSPGSRPEPKTDAQPLSHPGIHSSTTEPSRHPGIKAVLCKLLRVIVLLGGEARI